MCVDAELVRPDGLVWIAIREWEDWRFYWPALSRRVPGSRCDPAWRGVAAPRRGTGRRQRRLARAARRHGPADLRDVLEQTQLGPEELAAHRAKADSDTHRTFDLWGRIAAKEAARRLWLASGDSPRYPADLSIILERSKPPRLHDLARPENKDLPAISIAHTEGIVVALAARNSDAPVGIDIEPINESAEGTEFGSLVTQELA